MYSGTGIMGEAVAERTAAVVTSLFGVESEQEALL
jgi:hypothetical protein